MSADRYTHTHQLMSYELVYTSIHSSITLLNTCQSITMCKFRCGNSNIPYISGRFRKISRTDRLCNLCDDGVVGDEFHY